MGNCCGSQDGGYDDIDQPNAEARREAAREAAERRLQNQANRGIQDPAKVQRMQQRSEELDRMERTSDAPVLRWQTS